MNMRTFAHCLVMTATFVMSCFLTGCGEEDERLTAAAAGAPDSLIGRRYAFSEPGGTSTMLFLQDNRYEFVKTNNVIETGFFSATRSGDTWNVAETTADGSLTTQYAFLFTSPTAGQVTTTVAGTPHRTFPFQDVTDNPPPTTTGGETNGGGTTTTGGGETNNAPAVLVTMHVQNEISQTGPSFYTIHFSAAGQFTIDLPGYGSGNFLYTPGTNTAHLVLNYTGDLVGDVDDLNLVFKAPSGSTIPSLQSGTQTIGGQVYPVQGTFTFTGATQ
jgi:hypothetical protein